MSKSVIVTELRLRDILRQWMVDEMDTSFDVRSTYEAERIADRMLDAVARGAFPGLRIVTDVTVTPRANASVEIAAHAALVFDAGDGP